MSYSPGNAIGSDRKTRRPWAWFFALPILPVLGVLLYAACLFLAEPLLWIKDPPRRADAIVVLGGDGPRRAAQAAQLYREGMAPHVFVVGDGDCLHIALAMVNAGVPASRIAVECKSGNTWENAQFSAPLLAQAHIGSGLIVTSWFHTRRALASFRSASPGIAWTMVPTRPEARLIDTATTRDGWAIVLEYFKVAGYALKYGVNPLDMRPRKQSEDRPTAVTEAT